MLPFGQTVYLWRLQQGLTQAQLAERARITRPNLSAIERGRREGSLSTLRALAVALDVRPGVLAEGIAPGAEVVREPLSREAMERIADAVVGGETLRDGSEQALVHTLRAVVEQRGDALAGKARRSRRGKRSGQAAWLRLTAIYPAEVVKSLLQRIADRQRLA